LSHGTTSLSASSDGSVQERVSTLELDGRRYEVRALVPEPPHLELARRRRERAGASAHTAGKEAVVTPMQGTVLAVEVAEGDEVRAGQVLCIVEAMKMENEITAHRDGIVTDLSVEPGQSVHTGQVVCVVAQNDG
jgi:acetyl-CoA/propionyl-CoA carboxylase biotin carboxyl carrier protein